MTNSAHTSPLSLAGASSSSPSGQVTSAPCATTGSHAAPLDQRLFLDCVHCGLCTSACPTDVELGNENDSPRGRIYLMRAVTEGRIDLTPSVQCHLGLSLVCRACETACPSGVQYGRLIEPFRVQMTEQLGGAASHDWFHRYILFGLFPHRDRLAKALIPARLAQRLGLERLLQASDASRAS